VIRARLRRSIRHHIHISAIVHASTATRNDDHATALLPPLPLGPGPIIDIQIARRSQQVEQSNGQKVMRGGVDRERRRPVRVRRRPQRGLELGERCRERIAAHRWIAPDPGVGDEHVEVGLVRVHVL
jgi:hypothetical protein